METVLGFRALAIIQEKMEIVLFTFKASCNDGIKNGNSIRFQGFCNNGKGTWKLYYVGFVGENLGFSV